MILRQYDSVKADKSTFPLPANRTLRLLEELKVAYAGFTWESTLWSEVGHRRSPYRTLVLFGLSARTRDALLVEICGRFFGRYPQVSDLAEQSEDVAEGVGDLVRAGQVPIVASMARVLANGVPRDGESLQQIKGVGDKIAECVLAYGWGEEALPLDVNCVRVLERVLGFKWGRRAPAPLRQGLKCVYLKQSRRFSDLSVKMVDMHEIIRLHGQVCCKRTPDCARCPVSACVNRREPQAKESRLEVSPALWDDWRELINEPVAV